MQKNVKNTVIGIAAILVGCGAVIGAMATKIHYDKTKPYRDEVRRLKKETDFGFSKEFLKELRDELESVKEEPVVEPAPVEQQPVAT
jgi:hypothetical protein